MRFEIVTEENMRSTCDDPTPSDLPSLNVHGLSVRFIASFISLRVCLSISR